MEKKTDQTETTINVSNQDLILLWRDGHDLRSTLRFVAPFFRDDLDETERNEIIKKFKRLQRNYLTRFVKSGRKFVRFTAVNKGWLEEKISIKTHLLKALQLPKEGVGKLASNSKRLKFNLSEDCSVIVLMDGYSRPMDLVGKMQANCTCSMVITPKHKIIVDTLTPWDANRLTSKLAEHGLTPDQIDFVICTHGHSDHTGCNGLFTSAKLHIVGQCISQGDIYTTHQFSSGPFVIDDWVRVESTPGHTAECVTVLVQTEPEKLTALTGDLFEREEDFKEPELWLGANAHSVIEQARQRLRILQMAQIIVPGHGPSFQVTPEHIDIAQKFLESWSESNP